jgi:hypothetical protein
MRTFLTIFSIVAIIGIGLYLKQKGIIFPSQEQKSSSKGDRFSVLDEPGFGYQRTDSGTLKDLSSLLKGEWNLTLSEAGSQETRLISGSVEFKDDDNFIMHITEYAYDEYRNFSGSSESEYSNYAEIISGGSIKGKWKVTDKWQLDFIPEDYNLNTTYEYKRTKLAVMGHNFFKYRSFGDVFNSAIKMKIVAVNSMLISITGKDYTKGASLVYVFNKAQQK